jgi:hypothetical protein
VTKVNPCKALQRVHPPEERILMMDYAATQARAEGALLPPRGRWGLAEAATTKAMVFSPPPITSEVDRLYRQLTEIHTISAAQLVECTRWRRSGTAPDPFWVKAGWPGPDGMPSATRTALPPPTNFFPRALLRCQGPPSEPLACRHDCQISVRPEW